MQKVLESFLYLLYGDDAPDATLLPDQKKCAAWIFLLVVPENLKIVLEAKLKKIQLLS